MPSPLDFLLVNTRIRVIDTETCSYDGLRYVVAVAVVEVNNGRIEQTHHWLLNPTVPIDEKSHSIHGITDEQVAGCPTFDEVAENINQVLTEGDGGVVWVAHNVSFDVRVLRREYDRAGLDWVNVPVLDTMTLGPTVGEKQLGNISLPTLAERLSITGLQHHDPVSDATITAHIFLKLASQAHLAGITDIGGWITVAGAKTTLTVCEGMPDIDEPETVIVHPTQTDTHTARHLTAIPDNTEKSVRRWIDRFLECCAVGCEYARETAELVEPFPEQFLKRLRKRAARKDLGYLALNTAMDAVQPLIAAEGIPSDQLFTWWVNLTKHGTRTCIADALSCPSCRESKPCPADVFYQTVAGVISGSQKHGYVAVPVVKEYVNGESRVRSWVDRGGSKVIGFVLWECCEQAAADGDPVGSSKLRLLVGKCRLDEVEPRLALQTATRLLADGQMVQAQDLVEEALTRSNTDPGYQLLRDFQTTHLHQPPDPVGYPIKTTPRHGTRVRRPVTRVETPRFKLP